MLPPNGAVAPGEHSVQTQLRAADPGDAPAVIPASRPSVGGRLSFDDRWMSLQEASQYLGVSDRTIQRMVKDKKLPERRIGRLLRFKRTDLDKLLIPDSDTAPAVADLGDFIGHNLMRDTP